MQYKLQTACTRYEGDDLIWLGPNLIVSQQTLLSRNTLAWASHSSTIGGIAVNTLSYLQTSSPWTQKRI
jgi:hypothetical protein